MPDNLSTDGTGAATGAVCIGTCEVIGGGKVSNRKSAGSAADIVSMRLGGGCNSGSLAGGPDGGSAAISITAVAAGARANSMSSTGYSTRNTTASGGLNIGLGIAST